MTVKERYTAVIERFEREMPIAETELHFGSPFQLLVAVILSAQCTDKRINQITPALFEAYPNAMAMSAAQPEDILHFIKSVSYPNNKTKALLGMSKKLVQDFGGEVPDDLDHLLELPGVGRKTANVILAVLYNHAVMAVDTHVFRVSERIGLATRCKTPYQTEMALMRHLPTEVIPKAHHWLILHGRYVCKARKPMCTECYLKDVCRFYAKNAAKQSKDKAPKSPKSKA